VWIACPNLMVRREAFWRVGGFEPTLDRAEDLDLLLRVVDENGGEVATVG